MYDVSSCQAYQPSMTNIKLILIVFDSVVRCPYRLFFKLDNPCFNAVLKGRIIYCEKWLVFDTGCLFF